MINQTRPESTPAVVPVLQTAEVVKPNAVIAARFDPTEVLISHQSFSSVIIE
jgi:hypothetical protein